MNKRAIDLQKSGLDGGINSFEGTQRTVNLLDQIVCARQNAVAVTMRV